MVKTEAVDRAHCDVQAVELINIAIKLTGAWYGGYLAIGSFDDPCARSMGASSYRSDRQGRKLVTACHFDRQLLLGRVAAGSEALSQIVHSGPSEIIEVVHSGLSADGT